MLMSKTIFSNLLNKYATRLHPFEQRPMPKGFRGRLQFSADTCIMCGLCARKCPTHCITINADTGLWEREVKACVFCGVCAECCPTHSITQTNVYRSPITEAITQHYQCKPRQKKAKDAEAPAKAK